MVLPFSYYDQTQEVRLSQERKMLEIMSMERCRSSCPELREFGFVQAPHNSRHDALLIETLSQIEGQSYRMVMDVVTTRNYPQEEPMAFLILPDVTELIAAKVFLHTYRSYGHKLDGKAICGLLQDGWQPNSTIGQYYNSVLSPWIANFACFLHFGPSVWPATKWTTTVERRGHP